MPVHAMTFAVLLLSNATLAHAETRPEAVVMPPMQVTPSEATTIDQLAEAVLLELPAPSSELLPLTRSQDLACLEQPQGAETG